MSCALTQGFAVLPCKDGAGGVIKYLITEFANVVSTTEVAGVITAITMAPGSNFWEYAQLKETADWTEDIAVSSTGATIGYTQTANILLFKRDVNKRNEIKLLAQNRLIILVQDKNLIWWILGITQGCDLTSSKYSSGKKINDDNSWPLVFVGAEVAPAQQVNSAIIAALLIPNS